MVKSFVGTAFLLGSQWMAWILVLTLSHAVAARAYGQVCGFGYGDLSSFSNLSWLVLGHSSPWCPAFLSVLSSTGTLMSSAWLGGFGLLSYCSLTAKTPGILRGVVGQAKFNRS